MSMLNAFKSMAKEEISKVPIGSVSYKISMAGAEQELFIYNNGKVKMCLARDEEKKLIVKELGKNFGPELGASCIEIHPEPVNLTQVGFKGWFDQLKKLEDVLNKKVGEHGFKVGRCGTIPWADTTKIERSDLEKYIKVPNFHNDNKVRNDINFINGIFVGDASVVGVLNAFQFSVECNGLTDAIDKLNRFYMISPISTALSGNARFLSGKDTGWEDIRFEAWRRSHDTRSKQEESEGKALRIGLPNKYFESIEEYLEEVSSYPFILDDESHALQIGIGLFWRDARIKFINDNAIVEFRPLSTQPSLEREIEIAAFTIGRLIYSQYKQESLIPMEYVHRNKLQAEKYGLKGLYVNADGKEEKTSIVMVDEIEKALQGLKLSGIPDVSNFDFSSYKNNIKHLGVATI